MSEKSPEFQKESSSTTSWSHENAVSYYSAHRNSVADIYESEKFFLSRVIRPGFSILDIGCATGGFLNVFKGFEPSVAYAGVDISAEMIRQAQLLHPGIDFRVADGSHLPFANQQFDVVFSSGALHMAPNWREILAEGWRVARKYFLFDVRLKERAPSIEDIGISYEKIAFSGHWDGKTIVPYIIIDAENFIHALDTLSPMPAARQVHGYFHKVSDMTVSPEKEVCMTMCCLVKTGEFRESDLWDIPLRYPVRNKSKLG